MLVVREERRYVIRTICMDRAEKHRDECSAPVHPLGVYECHEQWRERADYGGYKYQLAHGDFVHCVPGENVCYCAGYHHWEKHKR